MLSHPKTSVLIPNILKISESSSKVLWIKCRNIVQWLKGENLDHVAQLAPLCPTCYEPCSLLQLLDFIV